MQKILRPGAPAVDVAKVFARRAYDPSAALWARRQIEAGKPRNDAPTAIESAMSPAGSP
jgi:hypothetical protein